MSEDNSDHQDHITLKWGTLKSWRLGTDRGQELLREYFELGSSASAMCQKDSPRQKQLIVEMIDECRAEQVLLDWDGEYVSKERAKEYVLGCGKEG